MLQLRSQSFEPLHSHDPTLHAYLATRARFAEALERLQQEPADVEGMDALDKHAATMRAELPALEAAIGDCCQVGWGRAGGRTATAVRLE